VLVNDGRVRPYVADGAIPADRRIAAGPSTNCLARRLLGGRRGTAGGATVYLRWPL